MDIKNILLTKLTENNLYPKNSNKIELLVKYIKQLYNWNKKINLISKKNMYCIIDRHIIDSLQIFNIKDFSHCETMLDIGSGAGLPGIPIYIFSENKKVYLIESNNKKVSFLNYIKSTLQLNNLFIINKRVEDIKNHNKFMEKFDCVISRAFSNFKHTLEISNNFTKYNGYIIYYTTMKQLISIKQTLSESQFLKYNRFNYFNYKIGSIDFCIFYVQKLWKTSNIII